MKRLRGLLLVACAVSGCGKEEGSVPPSQAKTGEERIVELLVNAVRTAEERGPLEQRQGESLLWMHQIDAHLHGLMPAVADDAPDRYEYGARHERFIRQLLHERRPGLVERINEKVFNGYVQRYLNCRCDMGYPDLKATDPGEACAELLEKVLDTNQKLHEMDLAARSAQEEFARLAKEVFGPSAETMDDKERIKRLIDLVTKHRPDAVKDVTALIKGVGASNLERSQNSVQEVLQTLYFKERAFRIRDLDGNGVNDYWTADVAGVLNLSPGERTPATDDYRSWGYVVRPVRQDTRDAYAFFAVPEKYAETGRQTYLISESGTLWCKDTGGDPVERFPADPVADGWVVVWTRPPTKLEELSPILRASDAETRNQAYSVIWQLEDAGREEKLAAFLEVLSDPNAALRESAVVSLGWFEQDPGAIAALRKALEDTDLDVRAAAAMTLADESVASAVVKDLCSRGSDRLSKGEADAALNDFNKAIGLSDENAALVKLRGDALLQKGEWSAARSDYERCIEMGLESADVYAGMAQTWVGDDSLGDARLCLNKAIELAPGDASNFRRIKAQILIKMGDREDHPDYGIDYYTEAIEAAPDLGEGYLKRAQARLKRGESGTEVEADFSRAVEVDPRSVDGWIGRATFRRNTRDLEGALGDYAKAAELNPDLARREHAEVLVWKCGGATVEVTLTQTTLAIERDPTYAEAYVQRSMARQRNGDADGAYEDISKAISLESDNYFSYGFRSRMRREKGDLAGAIADLTKTCELAQESGEYRVELACAKLLSGDDVGAQADFDAGVALEPAKQAGFVTVFAQTLEERCEARLARGEEAAALADCRRAVELNATWGGFAVSHVARYFTDRAEERIAESDFAGAVADCDKAIEVKPESGWAYNIRGLARRRMGDANAAQKDLARAVELQPDLEYRMRGMHGEPGFTAPPKEEEKKPRDDSPLPDAAAYLKRAQERFAANDAEGAFSDATFATHTDPSNPEIYRLRAKAQAVLKYWNGVIQDCTKLIEMNPKDAEAYHERGVARREWNEFDGSVADFKTAAELNPETAAASDRECVMTHLLRAKARAQKGDVDGVVEDFAEMFRLDPGQKVAYHKEGYVDALRNRVASRIDTRDYEGALKDAERAVEVSGESALACSTRSAARACVRDLDGALADIDRSVDLAPEEGQIRFLRVKLRCAKRLWADAESDLRVLITHYGDAKDVFMPYVWLAVARRGARDEATEELKKHLAERKKPEGADWDASLLRFLLGEVSETDLLTASAVGEPDYVREQTLLAKYFVGTKALLDGDTSKALAVLKEYAEQSTNPIQSLLVEEDLKVLQGGGR